MKRKARAVLPTRCRFCKKIFYDKVYNELIHKVVCPFCFKVNAKVDYQTIDNVIAEGLRYDLGMSGKLGGFHLSMPEIKKFLLSLKEYESEVKKENV